MGGGGFTMEPGNPLLDDFVLSLARSDEPRILFLPTASGDTSDQINAFKSRFHGRLCVHEHVSLFRMRETTRPLAEMIAEQDVIYVGGGSMRNLLALWRAHEVDDMLLRAWRSGTVLAGLSAGAMCWFQGGVTRSSGPPQVIEGLGILPGSLTVHADGEPERLPVWLSAVKSGELPGGWALDDGVGMLMEGDHPVRIVSSRPGAGAGRADAVACELVRRRIEPELLGRDSFSSGHDDAVDEMREHRRMRQRRDGAGG
jgi:dipeptidase E